MTYNLVSILSWLLLITAIIYTIVCLYLFFQQCRFIFSPKRIINTIPHDLQMNYEDVWIPVSTRQGRVELIHGWWIPSIKAESKVLLYFHATGGNMGNAINKVHRFHKLSFSVLVIDYRGYGRSEGSFPTEFKVYQDAQVSWDYLIQKRQLNPKEIFIYGHSLGTGIAIDLVLNHPEAAGLILESAFTSIREMVKHYAPWSCIIPVDLLLYQKFDSITKVGALQIPVMFIHGEKDTEVPKMMSETLFKATASKKKEIFLVPKAGHFDVGDIAGAEYIHRIKQFVRKCNIDN